MTEKTLEEIAKLVGGSIKGDPKVIITGIANIKEATPSDLTFITRKKYVPFLNESHAGGVLIDKELSYSVATNKNLIIVDNPSNSLNQVTSEFFADKEEFVPGVSDKACIGKNVSLGKNVTIEPFVVIENNSVIGDNSVIQAGTYIGKNVKIGSETRIYPNVSILRKVTIGSRVIIHSGTVIGSDGFGFEPGKGIPLKIMQVGTVIVEDDVEIGANVAIDRARFDKTLIKRGTKIDNLVHIAHNVEIGENCLILGQVGIAGSSILGKGVIMAGQSGITGHVTLGDRVTVTSKAGVTKNTPTGEFVSGYPAFNHQKFKRITVSLHQVPELIKKIQKLEQQINQLEKQDKGDK